MQKTELEHYTRVQKIAKETMEYLKTIVKSGMTETEIKKIAEKFMLGRGVNSFWYYGVGALVLSGSRTTLSVSGKEYAPSAGKICGEDIVSVDLSPAIGQYWGDFARTLVISGGKAIEESEAKTGVAREHFRGVMAERQLHKRLVEIARPGMAFGELYLAMNKEIGKLGYGNIDFKGNLGHSIEKRKEDRSYIEKGNSGKLGDSFVFAFEPHIKKKGGIYGYKMEDIYYFSGNKLKLI